MKRKSDRPASQAESQPQTEAQNTKSRVGHLKSRHTLLNTAIFNESGVSSQEVQSLPKLPPGTVINGRYSVLASMSEGGMGVIYRVSDQLNPDRGQLALKTLRGAGNAEIRALFSSEFANMAQLQHPNVALVYDFEHLSGTADCMFTMEFIDGIDIYSCTHEKDLKEIIELVVQICRGLSYIHSRGLIHFDLKPANVLVNKAGQVKILDFGLADFKIKDASIADEDESIRGTLAYLAPELASAKSKVDSRADLYSLGIMLYELVCRKLPFNANTTHEWIHKHHFEEITFDESSQTPDWLQKIIIKLCAKSPDKRFETPNALIEAINSESGSSFEAETSATRDSYILTTSLVAREKEMTQITNFLQSRVVLGGPKSAEGALLLLIGGKSGSGKSRLMKEVRHEVQLSQLPFIEANCYENDLSEFGPVSEALSFMLGLAKSASADALVAKYAPELRKACPKLEFTLFTPAEEDNQKDKGGDLDRERLIQQVGEFMIRVAQVKPYVLYFNDLQWASNSTADLLLYIARRVCVAEKEGESKFPMAVLGTMRSDEIEGRPIEELIPKLATENALAAIELEPFGKEEVHTFLCSMLGEEEMPEELVVRITEVTRGNPFFIQEVMRALVENGSVRREDGKWAAADKVGTLEIPTSISAAFLRRISSLSELEKTVVDQLAICDRPIWLSTLCIATQKAASEVQVAFNLLARKQIVTCSDDQDPRYELAHAQMRVALIAQLPPDKLKDMHFRTANALKARFEGDAREAHSDWLAHHYSQAERWNEAIVYGIRAAKASKRVGQAGKALKLLELSRNWLNKRPETIKKNHSIMVDLLLEMNGLYELQGASKEQQTTLLDLLAIIDPEQDSIRLMEVFARVGDTHTLLGQFDEGQKALEQGLAMAQAKKDITNERRLLRSLAYLFWRKGDRPQVQACYEDLFEIDRSHADLAALALDLANFGNVLMNFREFDQALEVLNESLAVATGAKHKRSQAAASSNLSMLYKLRKEYEKALEASHRAYLLAIELMWPQATIWDMDRIGDIYWDMGNVDEATKAWLIALDTAREHNYLLKLTEILRKIATRYAQQARYPDAVRYLEEVINQYAILGDSSNQMRAITELAAVCEKIPGKEKQAYAAWEQLHALCGKAEDPVNAGFAMENMGRLARSVGLPLERAIELVEASIQVRAAMGDFVKQGVQLNFLGSLTWKEGKHELALAFYRRALEALRKAGDPQREGLAMNSIGLTLKSLKLYAEARDTLIAAAVFNQAHDLPLLEGHSRSVLADVYLEEAQESALAQYERSRELRVRANDRRGEGWMLLSVARIQVERKLLARAIETTKSALEIAREVSDNTLRDSCDKLLSSLKGEEFKKYLEVLLEVHLASSGEMDQQERVALDQVIKLLNADRAFLFLQPEEQPIQTPLMSMPNKKAQRKHGLQFRAGRDSAGVDLPETVNYSMTAVREAQQSLKACVLTQNSGAAIGAQSMVVHGLLSIIAAPLLVQGRCVGVIYVDSKVVRSIFTEADADVLAALSSHIAVALESKRAAHTEMERRELLKDMEVAGSVQTLLIPKKEEGDFAQIQFAAKYQSAAQSGGDWWWHETRADGSMLFIIGDVTGHGVGPAMVTATIASAYQMISRMDLGRDISEVLKLLNSSLYSLTEGAYLMSMIVLEVRPQEGKVRGWTCGTPPAFLRRKSGEIESLSAASTQLGLEALSVGTFETQFNPGDQVFVFTDGVYEFEIGEGKQYSRRELFRFYKGLPGKSCFDVRTAVWDEINSQCADQFDDDITYILIDHKEGEAGD